MEILSTQPEKNAVKRELRNVLAKLDDQELITAILDGCYTSKGRLNKSKLARKLGVPMNVAEQRLQIVREQVTTLYGGSYF
jgi:hypothetical protein